MGTDNYIARYIADEGLRVSIAVTTQIAEEAKNRHDLYPLAVAALGRTMTGAVLLASDYKNKESVTVKIAGDGPLGGITADAYNGTNVRGYVDNPHATLPLRTGKLDVGSGVGKGNVVVTRYSHLKTAYTSQAELVSGEIAEDLAYYLLTSEQTASTISLGVLVNPDYGVLVSGGFFVQALPGAEDGALALVEQNIKEIGPISQYLAAHPDGSGLADKILAGLHYKLLNKESIQFACTCSRERIEKTLLSLSGTDQDELLKDEQVELVCHYCGTKYVVTRAELKKLYAR